MKYTIKEKRIKTVNEAILDVEIKCSLLMNNIKSIGDNPITLDNFKSIL